jgi:transposase
MRFVPVKSPEQQAASRCIGHAICCSSSALSWIRGLLAEFGIDIPKGLERATLLMARRFVDGEAPDVPMEAAKMVSTLSRQALDIHIRLRELSMLRNSRWRDGCDRPRSSRLLQVFIS